MAKTKGKAGDKAVKDKPKAEASPQAKASPQAEGSPKALTITQVFYGQGAEDKALVAFCAANGITLPKPSLAYRSETVPDGSQLVWRYFQKLTPIHVWNVRKKKIEVHNATPESGIDAAGNPYEDDPSMYNEWDDILPQVRDRPVVITERAVLVGFHPEQIGGLLTGKRSL